MKRKILNALAFLFVIICVSLFFVVNYFYGEAVKRGVEVELYDGKKERTVEVVKKVSAPINDARQWFQEQDFENLSQTSFDGLTLYSRYLKNENQQNKAVILAHGYRTDSDKMGDYAKFYYNQGFDILIPDARGHGKSEGDYIGYGWHDRIDYLGWIDVLIEKYEINDIVLHGNSMGAATVLMVSGEELPPQVRGIIADSGYTSVKEELTHQLKHLYQLPAFPLLDFTSLMTKVRSGFNFEEASALEQVKENELPLFIIHGDKDKLVPTEMAYEIYEVAGGEKEIWIVPGAGHTKAYEVATEEFEHRLTQFLNRTIQ